MRILKTITHTRSSASNASPPQIAALWFGVQLVWGAVLGIALQARCAQLGGSAALSLFAWVATSGAIAAALTQLLAGPWSDRIRAAGGTRNRFYIAGVAAGALALPGFFVANSALTLVAAFIALQIALNIAIGPYQAIVPDMLPDRRIAIGSAWVAAMQSAGNAFGAVLAALIGTTLQLGVALAIGLILSAAVTLRHLRGIAPSAQEFEKKKPLGMRSFTDLFVSRALVYVGFYTLVGYLYFFIRTAVASPLDPTRASGIAILIFTLVGSAGAALAARPATRLDERVVVCAGGSFAAAALFAIATVHTTAIFVAGIILAGMGWGIFLCADWALACRVLPRHAMAGAMAIWNLAILVPQMAAPAIASALLGITHTLSAPSGPSIAVILSGVEMLAGALWIWRLPKKHVGN